VVKRRKIEPTGFSRRALSDAKAALGEGSAYGQEVIIHGNRWSRLEEGGD